VGTLRLTRYVVSACFVVLTALPAAAVDDLPDRCYPQLGVAFIEAAEKGCPALKVTFKAREYVAHVKKRYDDTACDGAAMEHVRQYRREMPTAWCLAAMSIVNGSSKPGEGFLELRR
jgi:hypothetical protein